MPDEFYGVETLLTSHKILAFSLFDILVKIIIFNVMKFFIKLQSRLSTRIQNIQDMSSSSLMNG